METIYRVESKVTGRGFYNHNHATSERFELWMDVYESTFKPLLTNLMDNGYGDSSLRPHPTFDGLCDIHTGHYFGFSSLDQLADWFPHRVIQEIVEGAISEWFCVVTYSVDEEFVLHGGRQVAFEKAYAASRHELTKEDLSCLL